MSKKIHIVFGPTASGKTEYSVELAQKFDSVIINGDSQQVYREIPIITNQASTEERKGVPHELFGYKSILEHSDIAIWLGDAVPMIKKVIDEGMIGDIVAARCYWNNDGVWVNERQAGQTEMEYQMRNWYYFVWLCGDHINEQHIHNIDVINWFKGGYPTEAVGMGGRQVRTDKKYGEIYDHHYVEFKYADGMILSSQCRHQPGTVSDVSEHLVGTKGRATEGKIFDAKGNSIWRYKGEGDPDPYQVEHDVLFDCIVNNKPINDAERGAKSTMTAIMGRMATYSGKKIKWEEALNSEINLMPDKYTWDTLPKTLPDKDGWYQIPMPGKTKAV